MKKQIFIAAIFFILCCNCNNQYKTNFIIENEKNLQELIHKVKVRDIFEEYNMVKYFDEEARNKVSLLAEKYNVSVNDFCTLFKLESGGNPKAVNKQRGDSANPISRIKIGRATGLIQWMPKTAKRFNTSTREIYNMNMLEQLNLAEQYLDFFQPKNNYNNVMSLYMAVFYPYAMDKPNSYIIGEKDSIISSSNPGITKSHKDDGILTVADVKAWT